MTSGRILRLALVATVLAAAAIMVYGALRPLWGPPSGETAPPAPTRQIGAEGGQWYEYDPAWFAEDLQQRHTVLVAVHAEWCIDCKAQEPIMTRLLTEPQFRNAVGYVVDFDRERKFLQDHKVRSQSTLIVFRDGVEVARAVAITSEPSIRALFEQGL